MLKHLRLLLPFTLALTAVLVGPSLAFGASRNHAQISAAPSIVYLASSFLVTKGPFANSLDGIVDGGMTLTISHDGTVRGGLIFIGGDELLAHGQVDAKGNIAVTLANGPIYYIIKAQGKRDAQGQYAGAFQVFNKLTLKQVQSGIWSGAPVKDVSKQVVFGFLGQVTKGARKGALLPGSLILDKQTLRGVISYAQGGQQGGAFVQVAADNMEASVEFGKGNVLFGIGYYVSAQGVKGYAGFSVGPYAAGEQGGWGVFFTDFPKPVKGAEFSGGTRTSTLPLLKGVGIL